MKQRLTIGTTQFTLCVRDQGAFAPMTTETLMQNRITDIKCAVAKLKPRKTTVRADSRVYPRWGATASTADYVREYHLANGNDWVKTFYQPLSTRITPIEGEDACLSGL